jgi:Protein of unknown function (DUF3298)
LQQTPIQGGDATMIRKLRILGLVASVLIGWSVTGIAGAQSACAELGGTVDPDQICQIHSGTASCKIDFSFPVDYPDQQPVTDYLTQQRDGEIRLSQLSAAQHWPAQYQLSARGQTYRSGTPASGTESLVLRMGQDAQPYPVVWYKAFDYDLSKGAPITFDTLFKPDTNPLDIVYPAVQRAAQKRLGSATPPTLNGGLDVVNYQNFAITYDAVIFFFGQGQLLSHDEGEFEVSVPRTELASVLA